MLRFWRVRSARFSFLVGLQLSPREPVFPAGACLQRQPSVGPQLSFRSETMWCLQQRDQKRDPDRTEQRNLSQKLMGGMFLAFGQQLSPRLPTDLHQTIQLLIELLRATTDAGLRQLFEPTATVARRIDFFSSAGNRPTSIQAFESIHDSREIFGDSQIATA
jgi:hypothetical protein